MGATRPQRIVCDIMIGDRFYKTFRGNVDSRPKISDDGHCIWAVDTEDIQKAILAKYPSISNKNFYICL